MGFCFSSENGEVEDFGNKWSMSAVLRYLKDNGYNVESNNQL